MKIDAAEISTVGWEKEILTDKFHAPLGDTAEESSQNYLPVTLLLPSKNIKRENCTSFYKYGGVNVYNIYWPNSLWVSLIELNWSWEFLMIGK